MVHDMFMAKSTIQFLINNKTDVKEHRDTTFGNTHPVLNSFLTINTYHSKPGRNLL